MGYVDVDLCSSITVFHVTLEVSKSLKSLFDFICETLVQKSSSTLNHFTGNNFEKFQDLEDEEQGAQLLILIMQALDTTFRHNRMDSILTKVYEDLVNSLVALFEIQMEEEDTEDQFLEGVISRMKKSSNLPGFNGLFYFFFFQLSNCLSELAASTEDETQWKYLNYQVLLNLRSPRPKVRLIHGHASFRRELS